MEIHVVQPEEFRRLAADALVRATDGFRAPVVGLATGSTPIGVYEELASRSDGEWLHSIRPFAIDEYGGPRDHPCSNRRFFARYWDCIPGAAPVEQFDPDAPDRPAECARFTHALTRAGGLDAVVLGIGVNGHLAFNEPGSTDSSTSREVQLSAESMAAARACWGSDVPTTGLTLGLAEILGARRVIMLANGARKAEIVARALRGAVEPGCPASFLQRHPAATVVLDTAAGASLDPDSTHAH